MLRYSKQPVKIPFPDESRQALFRHEKKCAGNLFFCRLQFRDFLRYGAGHDFLLGLMQAAPDFGCEAVDRRLQHVGQAVANPLFLHEVDPLQYLT